MSDQPVSKGFEDYTNASNAQAEAANPNQSAWVAANAGSGKTKVLIDRVARLLLGGAEPASILCITYTKAAANEMLARLFQRLGSWSVMPEDKLRDALIALDPETADYDAEDIRKARALFARALETPGGLRIETIHAFCSRILRRFPLEARVAPGFQEIEDEEAGELWDDSVKRAIIDAGRDDPDALGLLSLAGGASGAKAEINTVRGNAASLSAFAALHKGNEPRMFKAIRDALHAPEGGSEDYLGAQMSKVDWAGLKAILPSLLNDAKTADKNSATAIEDALGTNSPADKWAALARMFLTKSGGFRKTIYNAGSKKDSAVVELLAVEGDLGSVTAIFMETQATLKAIQAAERSIAILKIGLPALEHYNDFKGDQAALDFEDLILRTRDLLTRTGVAAWVLYKLDGGLEHVLLDEAQDTSPHQWTLINSLTEEFFSGIGLDDRPNPRTLFVVGDEKQSIYSFQGADPEKFTSERKVFIDRCEAAEVRYKNPNMQMSFRSSPEILSYVDAVWNSAPDISVPHYDNPPTEADAVRHVAHRADQPGFVEFWPLELPDDPAEDDPWTPFSNLKALDQLSSGSPKSRLAEKVASEVARMIADGESVWQRNEAGDSERRAMHAGDVLILVKKRTGGLFDALIKALKAKGLPVAGADRLVLKDHIGVQDCLNLIRFALLPSDDLTLAEILRGPFCNLVDDDAHLFPLAHNRDNSLWDALQGSANPEHAGAKALMQRLIDMRDTPAFEFLSNILETPIDQDETGWDLITKRLGLPARDPIEALLAQALAHDARNAASLQTFIAHLDVNDSDIKRDLEEAGEAVRVMTVHGAKGLQAPVVILPDTTGQVKAQAGSFLDLAGGKTPVRTGKANDDTPEMEAARNIAKAKQAKEHRRLLYVALTRAQDRLLICGAWSGLSPQRSSKATGRSDDSWFALCEAGLAELGLDIPEAGGEPVRYGERPALRAHTAAAQETVEDLPDWLRTPASQETTARRYTAPTALDPREAPVLSPFKRGHASRLNRGRLIHALLQRLPDIAPEDRQSAGQSFLNADTELTPVQRREYLDETLRVLNHKDFSEVFQPGGRAEAPVIGRSPLLPEGVVINGRVDRLVVTETDVLIIDFKTDRPPPSAAEEVGESYLKQMAAYHAVLKEAYPHKNVRCALLWTDTPKLMELSENLLLASLKGLSSKT